MGSGKKVLLIDDDVDLGRMVELILRPVEVTVYHSYSGIEGLKTAYDIHPDLVILDIMMPGMDGFDVCTRLREISTVPILMLTARSNENDMIRGFNLGVDDFVRKPFNKNELEARVRALLRRSYNSKNHSHSHIQSYKDPVLEIDLANATVKLCGEIIELSPREYDLLNFLVQEQGKILSHHQISREVWGEFQMNGASLVSLYICYLRKKLQDGQHGHEYIRTNWGRGYWFDSRKEELQGLI